MRTPYDCAQAQDNGPVPFLPCKAAQWKVRLISGKPDTSRGVRPVWRGAFGNLPQKCGKALGAYPTFHGDFADPLFLLCGRNHQQYRKKFSPGLRWGLPGRGNHRPCLRHFYCHGVLPAAGKPRRGGRHGGMELYHGSDFQFIGFSRRGQNERPNRQGIIGIVKKRWNYSSAFYQLSE